MKNKGFTLIELVIAVFVITVGVVGTFTVLQKVLVSSSLSSSRLVASYLTQEGIEIIRNIRDTNWVEGSGAWDANIGDESSYYLDYQSSEFPDSTNCTGDSLNFDESQGFYTCHFPTGRFERMITISKPETSKMEITVEVSWKEFGETHTISAQEVLYEWYNL